MSHLVHPESTRGGCPEHRHLIRPPAEYAAAYFVIAEALASIARRARASAAWVTARRGGGQLNVEVRDDGIGGALPAAAPAWRA